MSHLLDELSVTETGYRFADTSEEMLAQVSINEGNKVIPSLSFQDQYEYILHVRLATTFRANKVQYDEALRYAKKNIAAHIYNPIKGRLDELRYLVFNNQKESALRLIDELQKYMEA